MATSTESKPETPNTSSLQACSISIITFYDKHDDLQCFQCLITFPNLKSKERHVRLSHRAEYNLQLKTAGTVFVCYVCNRSFSSSEKLTQHWVSHSTEDKPFRCTVCRGHFRTHPELMEHRNEECKRYTCKCCGKVLSLMQFRLHQNSARPQPQAKSGDDPKAHHCVKCNLGFHTEEELVRHQVCCVDDQDCEAGPVARKRACPPKVAIDKQRAEEERYVEALAEVSDQQGHPQEEQQMQELFIPCPKEDCDLTFPSVEALRAHKKGQHRHPDAR